jgi:UDP-N-acetyl-D-mannosaminuronic acid transferase (WecB/TagA/CpsF family)
VAGWVAATSRSPPTSHRELGAEFSYRQLTKPRRFADTL